MPPSVTQLDPVGDGPVGRSRDQPGRCLWCGRELVGGTTVGRRRRYCAQACRQRAYEHRHALERGDLPVDAVVLSAAERDDLADRLFQVRCAAEDVATAVDEAAPRQDLRALVGELLLAARAAERIR
ncbi:hypothetical protein JL107_02765 [Nakamurella flavida]|uniref:FCS-type domain-containing protein n=1 Tax=Nakamurella flavida TaxID=363630 RepID=A0A938YHT8_9ACTN|nr:hypothetical protein [Nakamurella flavida]MBM9475359.1 hypothetical protein [Nakamurella flavida]MDP9776937.1 hypothetical protein [Nakamurella flavida]